MHKLLCPTCNHVIETDQEEFAYCPNCFKKVTIDQGKRNLSMFISRHLLLANIELKQSTEYEKAVADFEKVLEVEPNSFDAAEGIVFATLYLSTLRESHLHDANEMLRKYKDTLQVSSMNFERSTEFINKLNSDLVFYRDEITKRLKGDESFYEKKGLDLYKKAIEELIEFKETIVDLYFESRKFPSKSFLTKESLLLDIKNLKLESKKKYSIESNPLHLLDTDVKETYIPDTIFKDNRILYKKRRLALTLSSINFLIIIAGVALIFALPTKLIIGVGVAGLGLLGLIASLITGVAIRHKLTK